MKKLLFGILAGVSVLSVACSGGGNSSDNLKNDDKTTVEHKNNKGDKEAPVA